MLALIAELSGSAFFITALATGVPAFFDGGFWIGLCGTLSPLLAQMAGGGIAMTLRDREHYGRGPVALGVCMIIASIVWVVHDGWSVNLFGHHVSGITEILAGAAAGALFGHDRKTNPPALPPQGMQNLRDTFS